MIFGFRDPDKQVEPDPDKQVEPDPDKQVEPDPDKQVKHHPYVVNPTPVIGPTEDFTSNEMQSNSNIMHRLIGVPTILSTIKNVDYKFVDKICRFDKFEFRFVEFDKFY